MPKTETPMMAPVHPGEMLKEDSRTRSGQSVPAGSAIGVPPRRINEIVHGTRRISADTALRLSRFFGMEQRFWMNLQGHYDIEVEKDKLRTRRSPKSNRSRPQVERGIDHVRFLATRGFTIQQVSGRTSPSLPRRLDRRYRRESLRIGRTIIIGFMTATEAESRRVETLTVIFTDMVDWTSIRVRLGEEDAEDLRQRHDPLVRAAVLGHGGRIVSTPATGLWPRLTGPRMPSPLPW